MPPKVSRMHDLMQPEETGEPRAELTKLLESFNSLEELKRHFEKKEAVDESDGVVDIISAAVKPGYDINIKVLEYKKILVYDQ